VRHSVQPRSQTAQRDNLCDLDGQTLTARNDDNEQAIEERLDTYERETSPVLEYYRTTPAAMLDVDGSPGTAGAGVGTDLPVAEKPMIVRKTASELEKMRQADCWSGGYCKR